MSFEVTININDEASEALQEVLMLLDGQDRKELNQVAGTAALAAITEYHRDFNRAERWANKSGPTHGSGRKSTRFGEGVTRAWGMNDADENGVTLVNGHPLLGFKIAGGVIRTKAAGALTIPMIPEAHGVRAGDYPGQLFRNKKETALLEKVGEGVRAVYLLRQSVTQAPVEGALPDEEVYVMPFIEAISDLIDAALS